MGGEVLGLGDAGVDIIMRVPSLPEHDEKILASRVEQYVGGVIANFLSALVKLGTAAGFIGCLGDDHFGRMVQEGLRYQGVNLEGLTVKAGEETYFCVTMLDDSGEKALVIGVTSTIFPEPDDVDSEMFHNSRLLHTTGLNFDTSKKALILAREQGLLISMDLEPSTLSKGLDRARELISLTDILFINQHSYEILFPNRFDPTRAGQDLLQQGPEIIIFTRGSEGSIVLKSDIDLRTPAFMVPVKDTTGAGDCFIAAFIHGLLQGWPLESVAIFANAAAAISITEIGAQTAQPSYEKVKEFLRQRSVDLEH